MFILRQTGLVALLCLSACTCPTNRIAVHQWSIEEQIEIAREHNALPANSILRPALDEWAALRAAVK